MTWAQRLDSRAAPSSRVIALSPLPPKSMVPHLSRSSHAISPIASRTGPLIWLGTIRKGAAAGIVPPRRPTRPGWSADYRGGHRICLRACAQLSKSSQAGISAPRCAIGSSAVVPDDARRDAKRGSRRTRRSSPHRSRSREGRTSGRRRDRPPRPSTGASPCRHGPAGRYTAPTTQPSDGSTRTCRRRRGTGTRNVARWLFYPLAASWLRCAAPAAGAESPFVALRDGPFGTMTSEVGAGGTVTAGRPPASS